MIVVFIFGCAMMMFLGYVACMAYVDSRIERSISPI